MPSYQLRAVKGGNAVRRLISLVVIAFLMSVGINLAAYGDVFICPAQVTCIVYFAFDQQTKQVVGISGITCQSGLHAAPIAARDFTLLSNGTAITLQDKTQAQTQATVQYVQKMVTKSTTL